MDERIEALIEKSIRVAAERGVQIRAERQARDAALNRAEHDLKARFADLLAYAAGIEASGISSKDGSHFGVYSSHRMISLHFNADDGDDRQSIAFDASDDPEEALATAVAFVEKHGVVRP